MPRHFHRRAQLETWAAENALCPFIAAPDDWPSEFRVPSRGLEPLRQGDYAMAQSAAFAAVNALRLVFAADRPLSHADEYRLLKAAWRWQTDRGKKPFEGAVRSYDWPRLVECLCQCLARHRCSYVAVSQPWREGRPSLDDFLGGIERLLVARHIVTGLFLGAHYSVIRGYTQASLLLFDSAGQRSIRRSALELVGAGTWHRHQMVAKSTLALRRSA